MAWSLCIYALVFRICASRSFPLFGAKEREIRLGAFENRRQRVPKTVGITPAFAFFNSLERRNVTIVADNQIVPETKSSTFLKLLRESLSLNDNLEPRIQQWIQDWDILERILQRECSRHNLSKWRTNKISTRLGLAIPVAPNRLWRTPMLLESFRYLEVTPWKIAMTISKPKSEEDFVELAGFLKVIERSQILRSYLPEEVHFRILYHDSEQFQWANRQVAAWYVESEYLTFFDNDDFIAPHRFAVIDEILKLRPEIDLLLSGYHGTIQESTFHKVASVIAAHWENSCPSNEDIRSWTQYGEQGYDEIFDTMHRPSILKWKLGSSAHEPLLGDTGGQCERLINIDRLWLDNWPEHFPESLRHVTQDELQWLNSVARENPPGRSWGDAPAQDGWPTLRRQVLDVISPPVEMFWGEDALFNWRIAAAGFNYKHFVGGFQGGSYVRWRTKQQILKNTEF